MNTTIERTSGAAVAGAAPCSALLEEAEKIRKAHVANMYAKRLSEPPREGWALQSQYMKKEAPHLSFCRGDGWWSSDQACLYPTKEMAQAYADSHRGTPPDVVYLKKDVECPNCYGGHFRPCQWCGDTGRVDYVPNAEVSDRRAHGNKNTTGANGGSLH